MTTSSTSTGAHVSVAPVAVRLPRGPDPSFYNGTQWAVLFAALEAVVPALVRASHVVDDSTQLGVPDEEYDALLSGCAAVSGDDKPTPPADLIWYLSESVKHDPVFVSLVHRILGYAHPSAQAQLGVALHILSSKLGAYIFTGVAVAFQQQSLAQRHSALQCWSSSRFEIPRQLFKLFTSISKVSWCMSSSCFLSLSGYGRPVPTPRAASIPAPAPPPSYPFQFVQIPPGSNDNDEYTLNTDVLIIGSGVGGAVSARRLAADAGLGANVLVVDKGYFYPRVTFPMDQVTGSYCLYENHSFVNSDDSSITLVAASCWGGGGVVNWSAMLRPGKALLEEWATGHNLPLFASKQYQDALDACCEAVGASAQYVRQNAGNRAILDGCKRLGWDAHAVPQNTGGEEHYCGQCHLGCPTGGKKDTAGYWLPAAAEAGARFIEGFQVDRILFEEDEQGVKVAKGVVGVWKSRDSEGGLADPLGRRVIRSVRIHAKTVILSAGSLWSPVILQKSGLKNPHIGSNLHLHPCHHVIAQWPPSSPWSPAPGGGPWNGGILTSVCNQFSSVSTTTGVPAPAGAASSSIAALTNALSSMSLFNAPSSSFPSPQPPSSSLATFGVRLETTCMIPYAILPSLAWTSALSFKLNCLKYQHINGFITLTRDRDGGRVFPDPITGRPRVAYTPSAFDRAHALKGVEALAKLCYVTGATEIAPAIAGLEPFVRSSTANSNETLQSLLGNCPPGNGAGHGNRAPQQQQQQQDPEHTDPRFAAWLRRMKQLGNAPPDAVFLSAHQMGTCKMAGGGNPSNWRDDGSQGGVVDQRGRVFGTRGLYVADASVFPSASGVNPMLTNMAISWCVAGRIGEELRS